METEPMDIQPTPKPVNDLPELRELLARADADESEDGKIAAEHFRQLIRIREEKPGIAGGR